MSISKVSEKEYSKNKIERILNVDEYVFEIDGKDIYNANVIYSLDNIKSTIYKDGDKNNIIKEPILSIELNGTDKNDNDAWISFDIKTNIDYLNTLSKIPIDVTNLLCESESFIKKPNEKYSGFLEFELPRNDENDIYRNLTSLWISKIKTNEFIFKLSVSNELFTYFKLIIK